ncbi:hypothetical protein Pmani_031283 [Petrolisthes manimaculis]|uniref:Uncharacterized protein n=1 Tax=Petrolisthes manimaculis TaxID=1843537 RepID=A0AAE1NVH4_9EUCA|nr:hypothetical protein Pmani_031283 [Petrolisthes manimaculis]
MPWIWLSEEEQQRDGRKPHGTDRRDVEGGREDGETWRRGRKMERREGRVERGETCREGGRWRDVEGGGKMERRGGGWKDERRGGREGRWRVVEEGGKRRDLGETEETTRTESWREGGKRERQGRREEKDVEERKGWVRNN